MTILHLSILAGRLSGRYAVRNPGRSAMDGPVVIAWQMPPAGQGAAGEAERTPSNPLRTYCAGQLAVSRGMAVVTLAAWLHVMRIHGATGL